MQSIICKSFGKSELFIGSNLSTTSFPECQGFKPKMFIEGEKKKYLMKDDADLQHYNEADVEFEGTTVGFSEHYNFIKIEALQSNLRSFNFEKGDVASVETSWFKKNCKEDSEEVVADEEKNEDEDPKEDLDDGNTIQDDTSPPFDKHSNRSKRLNLSVSFCFVGLFLILQ